MVVFGLLLSNEKKRTASHFWPKLWPGIASGLQSVRYFWNCTLVRRHLVAIETTFWQCPAIVRNHERQEDV